MKPSLCCSWWGSVSCPSEIRGRISECLFNIITVFQVPVFASWNCILSKHERIWLCAFPPVIQRETATELSLCPYSRGLERILCYKEDLYSAAQLRFKPFPSISPSEAYPQQSILKSLCAKRKKRWLPCAQPKHQLGSCKSLMDIMSSCCTSYKTAKWSCGLRSRLLSACNLIQINLKKWQIMNQCFRQWVLVHGFIHSESNASRVCVCYVCV